MAKPARPHAPRSRNAVPAWHGKIGSTRRAISTQKRLPVGSCACGAYGRPLTRCAECGLVYCDACSYVRHRPCLGKEKTTDGDIG
jgi:hypothetical protein